MSDNIHVAIRIRPLIAVEEEEKLPIQWGVQENNMYQIDDNGKKISDSFCFDHIFNKDKSNFEIYYDVVKDFVEPALKGLNSTIFAYGQTSSGKTYTMLGDEFNLGIMSLAIENIFECIEATTERKFLLRVSYIEIYNEKINDLLDTSNKDLKIRETMPGHTSLQNIKEELVSSREQVFECLKCGADHKKMGATNINERSSRSHTIFRIIIESTEKSSSGGETGSLQISSLNLVDLAGSERVAQSKATGVRLKEGGHINKSLSSLGLVIRQLSDAQEFVSFRDSKLTRLLQDSLGGNSKTLIIATVTLTSVEYTNSTLLFAQRAKAVKNKPKINEILTDATMNKRYAQLNANLEEQLQHQLNINENLKQTTEANEKALLRLKEQMDMLKMFRSRQSLHMETNLRPVIRRHTFAYSGQTNDEVNDNAELKRPNFKKVTFALSRIEEDEPIEDIICNSSSSKPNSDSVFTDGWIDNRDEDTTSKQLLSERLQNLEKDYNELVNFTRNEDNIQKLSDNKITELEAELRGLKSKFTEAQAQHQLEQQLLITQFNEKFKVREKELVDEINSLRKTCANNFEESILEEDVAAIKNQLCLLQELLHPVPSENQPDDEDNTKPLITKFISKIKVAKQMIKDEIFTQMSSFNNLLTKLNDPIFFPNELDSFNDLLNELILVGNDIPESMDQEQYINELKFLVNIYESLLRKNQFIGRCSEKIVSLHDQSKTNDSKMTATILEDTDCNSESISNLLISEFTLDHEHFNKPTDIFLSEDEFNSTLEELKQENVSEIKVLKSELSQRNSLVNVDKDEEIPKSTEKEIIAKNYKNLLKKVNSHIKEDTKNETIDAQSLNNNISLEILKRDLTDRDFEIKNLLDDLGKKNETIAELTVNCKQLEDVIFAKNKIIYSLRQKNGHTEEEPSNEVLKNSLSIANAEVINLKSAIEKLTIEHDEKVLSLTNIVLEKDSVLTEMETKSYLLQKDIDGKDEIISDLKRQITINDKIKSDFNEMTLVLQELEKNYHNDIYNYKQQLLDKERLISELKTKCGDLTDKCKILQEQILLADQNADNIQNKNDQNVFQYKNDCENLKQLLHCKEKEYGESLKKITSEKDDIILKIDQDMNSAQAEIRLLKNDLTNAHLKITELESITSKDNLVNNVKHQSNEELIQSLRRSISLLESKQGFYQRLYNESQKKNDNIKKHLELTRFRFDEEVQYLHVEMTGLTSLTDRKIKDMEKSISNLQAITNNLKDKHHINEENSLLELKLVLRSIIEHVINEQKAIMCTKHSPVEREYYKSVIKNMKCNNINLKSKLGRFEHATAEDLTCLKSLILETHDIFLQYHSLEKQFLAKQVSELEQNNASYVEEIISLKEKGDFKTHQTRECEECILLKKALSDLRISTSSEITATKSLREEVSNYKETITNLNKQLADGQSKVVLLDFYIKENGELKKTQENVKTCQFNSVETQCDFEAEKRKNYNLLKQLCENRKQKINTLRAQVALLEKKQ